MSVFADQTKAQGDDCLLIQPGPYARYVKRPLDVALVLLTAPLSVTLISIMCMAIAMQGGQPLYRQPRIGKGGRIYTIWKLRTMVPEADDLLAQHLASDPAAQAEWNAHQKLRNDPRITRLGRFLRKSSLDELPQLWNVLTGDMSLIGPRPMMPSQKVLYLSNNYYTLRPGISGMWQVSRRNASSFRNRAKFDTAYARNLTFKTDLKILFATLKVVWHGTGY